MHEPSELPPLIGRGCERRAHRRHERWLGRPPSSERGIGESWATVANRLRGDIGGFGAGSELAWYVNAFASRRLTDRLALTLGYRVWDFDREGDEDILEFDATLAGGSALTETTRFWFFTVGVVGLLLVFVLKLLRASTRTELIGWSLIVGGARSSNQISIQICFKKAIQRVHSWRLRKKIPCARTNHNALYCNS